MHRDLQHNKQIVIGCLVTVKQYVNVDVDKASFYCSHLITISDYINGSMSCIATCCLLADNFEYIDLRHA